MIAGARARAAMRSGGLPGQPLARRPSLKQGIADRISPPHMCEVQLNYLALPDTLQNTANLRQQLRDD
ncbi:MAG: hypothetical protein RBR35_17515 [Salinivirgaceae bacterium]|nr:hypothetical protein [Salinivirgaceae bacterium]